MALSAKRSINVFLSAAVALVIVALGAYMSTETALAQVNGEIDHVWVDHNVYEDSEKGMRIHVRFTARNMRGADGRIVAYFKFQNGTKLADYNGRYDTDGGNVSVGETFRPRYERSTYSDFKLFMPYDELHLVDGKHSLEFDIVAFHTLKQGYTQYARSDGHLFTYDSNPPNKNACRDDIQGRIAWDYKGSKSWASSNIKRLCRGQEYSTEPAVCFGRTMHGRVDWGGSTRWKWENAIDLCEGTSSANATLGCFRRAIANGTHWKSAIQSCSR